MDDLIILLVTWLVNSLGGKGKATSSPIVRPNPQASARPAVPMNRPMPPDPALSGNRPLPPNVRRVVIPANRRPQRQIVAPPPLPGRAAAQAQVPAVSVAKPVAPVQPRKAISRSPNAATSLAAFVKPAALRRQIIINEILQPPLALREGS